MGHSMINNLDPTLFVFLDLCGSLSHNPAAPKIVLFSERKQPKGLEQIGEASRHRNQESHILLFLLRHIWEEEADTTLSDG